MLKALLFDLDGTLADTDPIHRQVWADLLRPYGYEVNATFYEQHISGRLNPDIVQALLPHLSPAAERQFSADKEAQFRQAATQLKPLAGLLDLLAWAQQQALATALVTNAPRDNTEFMLNTLALANQFHPVVVAAELPQGKPDPLPYQEALRHLEIAPEEALVFEDSATGVRSAVAAGVVTIGVATSHRPDHLLELGASLVITDFADPQLRQFGLL